MKYESDLNEAFDAVAKLQKHLAELSADERLEIFSRVVDGYCGHCGSKYLPCHCQNDE